MSFINNISEYDYIMAVIYTKTLKGETLNILEMCL